MFLVIGDSFLFGREAGRLRDAVREGGVLGWLTHAVAYSLLTDLNIVE